MALVKGPFTFAWGAQSLTDISEISVDYTVDTNDISTLDGGKYSVQTGLGVTVTLTLLSSDVASLATILPQYFVAAGAAYPSGSTGVAPAGGAIDIAAASCNALADDKDNLVITACGTDAEVMTILDARTQVDSIDIGDGLRTITVAFVGEPASGGSALRLTRNTDPVTP